MGIEELTRNIMSSADELELYAEVDGTELGETCHALSEMGRNTSMLSEGFLEALNKEIEWHLENYQKNARIVEEEETITRKVAYLEWHNEGEYEED